MHTLPESFSFYAGMQLKVIFFQVCLTFIALKPWVKIISKRMDYHISNLTLLSLVAVYQILTTEIRDQPFMGELSGIETHLVLMHALAMLIFWAAGFIILAVVEYTDYRSKKVSEKISGDFKNT